MSWVDIENAVHAAVTQASGFTAEKVTWSYQNVNQPALDHIVIHFGGESMIGQDWVRVTQDLTRPNGQEIKQEILGTREVALELECFSTTTSGNLAARRTLELTRTKLQLPDIRTTLRRSNIALFDSSPVNYIPDIVSAAFRGRATCTVRCYVPVMDCIEYVGYIATVSGRISPSGWNGASGVSGIAFSFTV